MAYGKYGERNVETIDVTPDITTANTLAVWSKNVKDGVAIQKKAGSGQLGGNKLTVAEKTAASGTPIGFARALYGTNANYPKLPTLEIAVRATRYNVPGAATGALASTDYGKGVTFDANGKATIANSGGVGSVVGGDKANLVMAFDFIGNL